MEHLPYPLTPPVALGLLYISVPDLYLRVPHLLDCGLRGMAGLMTTDSFLILVTRIIQSG